MTAFDGVRTKARSGLKTLPKRISRLPPVQKATSTDTWRRAAEYVRAGKEYLDRNPRIKKFLVTLLILFVVWKVSTAIASYLTRPRIEMTMSPIAGALAVTVEPAKRGPIARTVTYTGTVQPALESQIYPRVEGWVREFLVDAGDRVRAGQLLIVLDREEIEGNYLQAKAHYEFMAKEFERAKKLLEGGAISQSEYDQVRMMYEEAEGRAQAAKARLDYTAIRALISGVVTKRVETVIVGQLVGPGAHLLTVADTRRMRVQARVAESDLPYLRVGTEATVRFPALTNPSEIRGAKVSTVFPGLDPITRTSTVEVIVDNREGQIRPEMYAVVDLVLEKKDSAVIVPRRAVLEVEGTPTVFLTDGVTATARPVTLGVAARDKVEILEGVTEGEMVIVKGNRGLVDGQLVKLVAF